MTSTNGLSSAQLTEFNIHLSKFKTQANDSQIRLVLGSLTCELTGRKLRRNIITELSNKI